MEEGEVRKASSRTLMAWERAPGGGGGEGNELKLKKIIIKK